jgi:hypothetical protein
LTRLAAAGRGEVFAHDDVMYKQHHLGHELVGTTQALFCARNNSALFQ